VVGGEFYLFLYPHLGEEEDECTAEEIMKIGSLRGRARYWITGFAHMHVPIGVQNEEESVIVAILPILILYQVVYYSWRTSISKRWLLVAEIGDLPIQSFLAASGST